MCGRFALTDAPEEVAALFGYLDAEPFPPRYNIAPTQPIAIVREEHHARRFALVRWGLVPAWVEDPKHFLAPHQRPHRGHRRQAGVQERHAVPPLPGSGVRLLRVAPPGQGEAAVLGEAAPGRGHRLRRPVGDLVRSRRRRDRFRLHRHHVGERDRRADPRPHAGDHRAPAISSSGSPAKQRTPPRS